MSPTFNPTSFRVRLFSVSTALIAAAGVVCSVLALAGYYDDEFLQAGSAAAQAVALTAHAHVQVPAQRPSPVQLPT